MREALVKLKEISSEEISEANTKVKILEKENYAMKDAVSKNEKLKGEVTHLEEQVDELKHMLDDSSGAEQMVEKLTENNLDLEEANQQLKQVSYMFN